jgi:hypothetical protein
MDRPEQSGDLLGLAVNHVEVVTKHIDDDGRCDARDGLVNALDKERID